MYMENQKQKLYEDATPFLSVYPDYDLLLLPRWVKENISNARVYGNQKKGIILEDGRKFHLNNTLNDLTGKEWTYFINSVFSTHYPTRGIESYAHEIRKMHPTPKPPQLMRDIISFFTKENELVIDTFMGVGGTLLGAALCNRRAAGIDLNQSYIDVYNQAAASLSLPQFPTLCGDSLQVLTDEKQMKLLLNNEIANLLLIDPPYANMMSKVKTGGDIAIYGNKATPFTNSNKDLGNMTYNKFLSTLKNHIEMTLPYIKVKGHVVVLVKDLQPKKKELHMLHADMAYTLNEIASLQYRGMKIWADTSTKLYPYGYPFSFVANQIHQYILIFRKEK